MANYKIYIIYPDKHMEYKEVKGYQVSIPYLKGIELFAHHPYDGPISFWNISEVKSGLALITDCMGTRKQAIEALKSKLAKIKTDNISRWLKTRIDKHIAEFGATNSKPLEDKG